MPVDTIKSPLHVSRTGCIECDIHNLPSCRHMGPSKGGSSAKQSKSTQSSDKRSSLLLATAEDLKDLRDSHRRPGMTLLTITPGYSLGRVKTELEELIERWAKAEGITPAEFVQRHGIESVSEIDNLVVSMSSPQHYYGFLNQLSSKGIAILSRGLQKEVDNWLVQQQAPIDSARDTGKIPQLRPFSDK